MALQAVKLRPGRGPVAVGPRLAIPETYAGWFELLSEEGRAGRCVESVAELSRRPCPCLVREPLRAILAKEDQDADEAVQAADASRTLAVGETISPGEEVSSSWRNARQGTAGVHSGAPAPCPAFCPLACPV